MLRSLYLPVKRQGFKKYYGTVYSSVRVGSDGTKFQKFSTPTDLQALDSTAVDKVVIMNQPILEFARYRQGQDLLLEIGLFKVLEEDKVRPIIDFLGKTSQRAGVSFVGNALPLLGVLEDGYKLLTAYLPDQSLQVGLSRSLNQAMTILIIAADQNAVDEKELIIEKDGNVKYEGSNLVDYAYFVIDVLRVSERSDWRSIPELAKCYDEIQNEVKKSTPDYKLIDHMINQFRRVALVSDDLVEDDATRIADKVAQIVKKAVPTTLVGARLKGIDLPALAEIELDLRT
jgi:hypothetical protein